MILSATDILWMVTAGVMMAVIYSFSVKILLGKFVSALLDIDAVGPENAISPDRLGIKPGAAVKQALKTDGMFSQTVKTDDGGATYYIEESMRQKSEKAYRSENARIIFVVGMLFVMLCVVLAVVFLYGGVITDLFNKLIGE